MSVTTVTEELQIYPKSACGSAWTRDDNLFICSEFLLNNFDFDAKFKEHPERYVVWATFSTKYARNAVKVLLKYKASNHLRDTTRVSPCVLNPYSLRYLLASEVTADRKTMEIKDKWKSMFYDLGEFFINYGFNYAGYAYISIEYQKKG